MGAIDTGYKDVVVDDQYYNELTTKIYKYCDELNKTYASYIKILKGIKDNAITSGDTHEAIVAFLNVAENINDKFANVGECSRLTIDVFLGEIDTADKYLY